MFYRFIRSIVRTLFKLFYHLKVVGTQNIPSGAAILAPNHASHLDPPLVGVACPNEVYFLARGTLFRPPLSWLIRRLNAHPVTRGRTDIASLKTILRLLSEGKKVVIFPEGTRSLDGKLQEVQHGVAMLAMRAGCPIVPISISGTYEVWKKGQKWPKLSGRITCYFRTPLYPHEMEGMAKKEAQKALTEKLTKALQKPREALQ